MSLSKCDVDMFLCRIDAPGAPENLQPSDVHAEYCKLSWLPPSDDGGAEITGELVVFNQKAQCYKTWLLLLSPSIECVFGPLVVCV